MTLDHALYQPGKELLRTCVVPASYQLRIKSAFFEKTALFIRSNPLFGCKEVFIRWVGIDAREKSRGLLVKGITGNCNWARPRGNGNTRAD
jgi:hypothetical protein